MRKKGYKRVFKDFNYVPFVWFLIFAFSGLYIYFLMSLIFRFI